MALERCMLRSHVCSLNRVDSSHHLASCCPVPVESLNRGKAILVGQPCASARTIVWARDLLAFKDMAGLQLHLQDARTSIRAPASPVSVTYGGPAVRSVSLLPGSCRTCKYTNQTRPLLDKMVGLKAIFNDDVRTCADAAWQQHTAK